MLCPFLLHSRVSHSYTYIHFLILSSIMMKIPFKFHLYCYKWQGFLPSHGWIRAQGICELHFLYPSFMNGHLGCSHILTGVHNAAVNTGSTCRFAGLVLKDHVLQPPAPSQLGIWLKLPWVCVQTHTHIHTKETETNNKDFCLL